MLERMQRSWGLTSSSLVIGFVHTFWHLPLWWVVGTNQIKMGFGLDFIFFVLFVVATSVVSTWCYMDNHHSTLAVTLLHCSGNLSFDIFAYDPGSMKHHIFVILATLVAIALITHWQTLGEKGLNRDGSR